MLNIDSNSDLQIQESSCSVAFRLAVWMTSSQLDISYQSPHVSTCCGCCCVLTVDTIDCVLEALGGLSLLLHICRVTWHTSRRND